MDHALVLLKLIPTDDAAYGDVTLGFTFGEEKYAHLCEGPDEDGSCTLKLHDGTKQQARLNKKLSVIITEQEEFSYKVSTEPALPRMML